MHERERVSLVNIPLPTCCKHPTTASPRSPSTLTNHLITKSSCCPPFSIKKMNQSIILFIPDHEPPFSSPRLSVWLVYVYLLSSRTAELPGLLWWRRRMLLSGMSSSIHKCRLLRARTWQYSHEVATPLTSVLSPHAARMRYQLLRPNFPWNRPSMS